MHSSSRPQATTFTDWGRRRRARAASATVTGEQAEALLREGLGPNGLLVRGAGRSYSDASVNSGGATLLLAERHIRWLDQDRGLLVAGGAATLREINEFAATANLMLPVTPGTQTITVGGAVAFDVHGKNHVRTGSFGRCVHVIELVDGTGLRRTLKRSGEDLLFAATLGGMGLTGVIVEVVLELVERRDLADVTTERVTGTEKALTTVFGRSGEFEHTVAWLDLGRGRGVVTSAHLTAGPVPRRSRTLTLPRHTPKLGAHNIATNIMAAGRWTSARSGRAAVAAERYLHPLDRVTNWNLFCGRSGFTQYQFMVPTVDSALDLLERIDRGDVKPFLTTVKALGKPSCGMLSFPTPGLTVALDFALPVGQRERQRLLVFLAALDKAVARAGGRVYLAKNAALAKDLMGVMYPQVDAFRSQQRLADPHGRLQSDLARALGICQSTEGQHS